MNGLPQWKSHKFDFIGSLTAPYRKQSLTEKYFRRTWKSFKHDCRGGLSPFIHFEVYVSIYTYHDNKKNNHVAFFVPILQYSHVPRFFRPQILQCPIVSNAPMVSERPVPRWSMKIISNLSFKTENWKFLPLVDESPLKILNPDDLTVIIFL